MALFAATTLSLVLAADSSQVAAGRQALRTESVAAVTRALADLPQADDSPAVRIRALLLSSDADPLAPDGEIASAFRASPTATIRAAASLVDYDVADVRRNALKTLRLLRFNRDVPPKSNSLAVLVVVAAASDEDVAIRGYAAGLAPTVCARASDSERASIIAALERLLGERDNFAGRTAAAVLVELGEGDRVPEELRSAGEVVIN